MDKANEYLRSLKGEITAVRVFNEAYEMGRLDERNGIPYPGAPNPQAVSKAIELLKADRRRSLYEAGDAAGGRGCGEYYVDYSNGASPSLNVNQVNELVRDGWLVADTECHGLYWRGRRLQSGIKST